MLFVWVLLFAVLLAGGLFYLVAQSKNPSGAVGRRMMWLWNRAYLPMARWAVGLVSPGMSPAHILDVGMGNGASTRLLAERWPGARVLGIDISVEAVRQAKRENAASSVEYRQADVSRLPLPDYSIGLVTAFQTHFHWPDLPAALAELRRVLRPGGVLLLACEEAKANWYLKELQCPGGLEALCAKAGFGAVQSHRQGPWHAWLIQ